MKDEDLEKLLARLRNESLPPAPDLRREVRAEINRLKARPTFWHRLLPVLHWNELLLQPRLAASALALAVIAGITPSLIVQARPGGADQARYARASLHFDVFDASANNVTILSPATTREP